MKQNNLPAHPDNKLNVTPVQDEIFTLEGNGASFPYGGTSGEWGYSEKIVQNNGAEKSKNY